MQLHLTLSFSEKRCAKCGEWLPIDRFGFNARTNDKLHHWCKPCINAGNRDYKNTPEGKRAVQLARERYNLRQAGHVIDHANPPRRRPKAKNGEGITKRERGLIAMERNVSFLRVIKHSVGCQVCGEHDPICLDYHHRDPNTKRFNLASNMYAKNATSVIINEVLKCHVLCANCHRKHHAHQFDIAHLPLISLAMIESAIL